MEGGMKRGGSGSHCGTARPPRAAMLDPAGRWGPQRRAPGGGQGVHGCPPPTPQHHEADLPLRRRLLRGTSPSSISAPL